MSLKQEFNVKIRDKYTINLKAERYESARDVVNDCKNRPVRYSGYNLANKEIKEGWHGVKSYEEALQLLDDGYQPTVERLREVLDVTPKAGPRFKFSNEPQGFIPIVPLALKCVPNSMIDMRIRPMKAKVLDIYYDMTASCSHDPEDFIKAGQVLLSTVIGLEKQGYRFNLYAIQSYYDGWNDADLKNNTRALDILCVKIKSSDKPIDLKRISFPLTHPAFFRVIGFDWQSKSPITRYIGSGRGRAVSYEYDTKECDQIMQTAFGNNIFYLSASRLIDNDYTRETLTEVLTNAKPKKSTE